MQRKAIPLYLCVLALSGCTISIPEVSSGTTSSTFSNQSSVVPDSENGHKTIEECTNEQACYNTLSFVKRQLIGKYPNLTEEEKNSIALISGHGDLITDKGTGVIYISYSFSYGGSKVVRNESYNLKDYGILDNRFFYNTVTFRSDESNCENGEKGTSVYIDVDSVRYFFEKYQNENLPLKKKVITISFYNWNNAFLREDTVEGYGTKITAPEASKPADKTYYYTLYGWKTESGSWYDLIARENVTVTAYYEQKNVEYTVTVLNYDGEELGTRKGYYQQSQTVNLSDNWGRNWKDSYYSSWDLRGVENGDTWFRFEGFNEESFIDSITPGYSIISGSRETHLYDTFNLKPFEDNFTLTAKYSPQAAYDFDVLTDGSYKTSLYKSLLYEKSLYGDSLTINIPDKAFTYENGSKVELGTVSEIGELCYSTREYIGDYLGTYDTANIVNVNFPDSIRTIGKGAFYYCNQLHNIKLNHGLVSIGDYAFACTDASVVYIPKTVTTIGRQSFSGRHNNEYSLHVNFEGSEAEWNAVSIHSDNDLLNKASVSFNVSF